MGLLLSHLPAVSLRSTLAMAFTQQQVVTSLQFCFVLFCLVLPDQPYYSPSEMPGSGVGEK